MNRYSKGEMKDRDHRRKKREVKRREREDERGGKYCRRGKEKRRDIGNKG